MNIFAIINLGCVEGNLPVHLTLKQIYFAVVSYLQGLLLCSAVSNCRNVNDSQTPND
jgi:hypothetical protein